MSRTIVESGMSFGPFDDDAVFAIETSAIYAAVGDGIKAPEFVCLRQTPSAALWFVEAKSSSPRPGNQQDLPKFLDEISKKFLHGLTLFVAACLNRHADPQSEVSAQIRALDPATVKIKLILVVKGHEQAWLPPLQDALRRALDVDRRLWGLDSDAVVVLNDKMAISRGLVAGP